MFELAMPDAFLKFSIKDSQSQNHQIFSISNRNSISFPMEALRGCGEDDLY